MTRQVLIFMRVAACAALVLLVLACVAEWNFRTFLAPEARIYQVEYPDTLASLSPDMSYTPAGRMPIVRRCERIMMVTTRTNGESHVHAERRE